MVWPLGQHENYSNNKKASHNNNVIQQGGVAQFSERRNFEATCDSGPKFFGVFITSAKERFDGMSSKSARFTWGPLS